ncbi:hypothetical protein [Sinorhizobium fredii]|uniref:hypothetical protein n=1 Tax=Rhizobium fredii TaxID=380 RepID=UPI001F29A142|nr:hypothetical protein [Sinorhizobium fredii]
MPIRTASYSMLTEASHSGLWRIAGAYFEASAFGGISLSCLSFFYVYWRKSAVRLLAVGGPPRPNDLFDIVDPYVGLTVLSIPVAFAVMRSFLSGRLGSSDVLIIALLAAGLLAAMSISLYQTFFDPFVTMIDDIVVDKASLSSGQERAYWNTKSLQAFIDTSGLGIGFGSSRASSWPIAVVGSLMMATLAGVIVRGMGRLGAHADAETNAVVSSVRAAAIGGMVSVSISGGTADPGMVFFIALAVISASRVRARRNKHAVMAELHQRAPESRPRDHDLSERATRPFGPEEPSAA